MNIWATYILKKGSYSHTPSGFVTNKLQKLRDPKTKEPQLIHWAHKVSACHSESKWHSGLKEVSGGSNV